jgi:hypothetical protein
MNRSNPMLYPMLLVLVLGLGACSTAAGSSSDLISDSYEQTGMLNPVEVVAERPDFMLDEVIVTAPAVRLVVEGTTVRLILPGNMQIEVSDFSPSADIVN